MTETEKNILDVEEEDDESPYVEFDISVSPSDPTLGLLAQQLADEEIIIPPYQRKYVWKIEQASKLIESFLMGLPVPQVFFYVNDQGQLEVIDGQQRMMSIKYFFNGYFGEENQEGNRKIFRLKGLSELSKYNGKTFDELSVPDQRKLRNSTLRAINIKQIKPSKSNDSVFYIFERLNTGGTSLRPQEIRHAIYKGAIVDELQKLNNIPSWQKILGLSKPDKNQKDVELILRLFSLYKNWGNYQKPMISFLNNNMKENREFASSKANEFKDRFNKTVVFIAECIDRPFRPKKVLNSAALEGVMIALLESDSLDKQSFKERYKTLMQNDEFSSYIRVSTTDEGTLKNRIKKAREVLLNETP